jgi:hypothetical protein
MIVVFKNFFRNNMVNLSKRSVRHFLPDAKIYCISLFKHTEHEYDTQEPLDADITNIFKPTKWVLDNGKPHDHADDTQTSGWAYPDNAKLFSEGINLVYEEFKHTNEKVLMLAEDHFFTSGETLRLLLCNEYDFAFGTWDTNTDVNGSIIGFRPQALSHLFPIDEGSGSVEQHLENQLTLKIDPTRRYRMPTRKHTNYGGDGIYTNSSAKMTRLLTNAGIL